MFYKKSKKKLLFRFKDFINQSSFYALIKTMLLYKPCL